MTTARRLPRRPIKRLAILAITASIALPTAAQQTDPFARFDRLDQTGVIVQKATGSGRAVYEPLENPVVLPHFIGMWAKRPGACVGQNPRDRMELRANLAIIAGHTYTLYEVWVDGNLLPDNGENVAKRAEDFAEANDVVVRFERGETDPIRTIHLYFSTKSGRLIFEEVGQPRRAFVRCMS